MKSGEKIRDFASRAFQLSKRFFATKREFSAVTVDQDLYPRGECDPGVLKEWTLASGAKWARGCQGDWLLLKSDGIEVDAAVGELLDHLRPKAWVLLHDRKIKTRVLRNLASLLQIGFGLPMHYIENACRSEAAYGQIESIQRPGEESSDAESHNSRKDGVNTNGLLGPFDPPIDYKRAIHEVGANPSYWMRASLRYFADGRPYLSCSSACGKSSAASANNSKTRAA